MKIAITGVTGQLGYDVAREAERRGHRVIRVDRSVSTCGRTEFIAIEQPDVLIHCAAYTCVDKAEDNRVMAYRANGVWTGELAKECRKHNVKMIYISSDYVFKDDDYDEVPMLPRKETVLADTDQCYGWTKMIGEDNVRHENEFGGRANIVRVSWVFGANGNNFVKTMLKLAKDNQSARVVNDQIGRPTYTKDLAVFLISMAEGDVWRETFHVQNEGQYISWFEFAKKIKELAGLHNFSVKPVSTDEYGFTKAVRPKNSMLDTTKLRESGFEPLPRWEDALARFLVEIKEV